MTGTEKKSEPHIHIERAEDGEKTRMTLTSGRRKLSIDLTLTDLTNLIHALGAARAGLVASEPAPSLEGVNITPVRRTSWALQLDRDSQGSILAFQHPAYGPVGLTISQADATRLVQGLDLHRKLSEHTSNTSGTVN